MEKKYRPGLDVIKNYLVENDVSASFKRLSAGFETINTEITSIYMKIEHELFENWGKARNSDPKPEGWEKYYDFFPECPSLHYLHVVLDEAFGISFYKSGEKLLDDLPKKFIYLYRDVEDPDISYVLEEYFDLCIDKNYIKSFEPYTIDFFDNKQVISLIEKAKERINGKIKEYKDSIDLYIERYDWDGFSNDFLKDDDKKDYFDKLCEYYLLTKVHQSCRQHH